MTNNTLQKGLKTSLLSGVDSYKPLTLLESILQYTVDKSNKKTTFIITSIKDIFSLFYSSFTLFIVPIFYFNIYIINVDMNNSSYHMLLFIGFLSFSTFYLFFVVGWNIYYKNKNNIFILIKILLELYINNKNTTRFYYKIILIIALLLCFIVTNMLGINIIIGYLGITKNSLFSYIWIRLSLLPFIIYINNIIISMIIKYYTKDKNSINFSLFSESMFMCLTLFRLSTIISFICLSYGGILLYFKFFINKFNYLNLYNLNNWIYKIEIPNIDKQDILNILKDVNLNTKIEIPNVDKQKWNLLGFVMKAMFGKSIWGSSHERIYMQNIFITKDPFTKISVIKPTSVIIEKCQALGKLNTENCLPFILTESRNITYFAFKTEGDLIWFPLTKDKSGLNIKLDSHEFLGRKSVKLEEYKPLYYRKESLALPNLKKELLPIIKLKSIELPTKTGKELHIIKLEGLKLIPKTDKELPSFLFNNSKTKDLHDLRFNKWRETFINSDLSFLY